MAMAADEMVKAREQLGLTRAEFAAALGVTRRAVDYWEAGERAISQPVELAVRHLLQRHPPRKRTAR
jgi:DNA-binding transcriptional regulator YiaG